MMKRPNVIIINPDQMRADSMHHMGMAASVTPNLDAIIEKDGVSFSNAFCQNPICTPSRCSFFSGLYPHVFGHRTISFMQYSHEPSLLKIMKENGYHVWMNDRNDFLPAQVPGIFSEYCDEFYIPQDLEKLPEPVDPNHRGQPGDDSYYSFFVGEVNTNEDGEYFDSDASAVKALTERIRNGTGDKPLCAFLGLMVPHPEYLAEQPFFGEIDRSRLPERIKLENPEEKSKMLAGLREIYGIMDWPEERFDELRAVYLAMCMKADNYFGEIVKALKDAGIYENTLIIFLSDHGDYTGDYDVVEKAQNTFEDCITNVPLIIKPPAWAKVKPGINKSLTELIDMYATVLDYAGVSPPETHFGHSLKSVIAGDVTEHRDFVFCEGGRRLDEDHCNSAAAGADETAIYYPRFKMQSTDACSKGTMMRNHEYKYVYRMGERDELYDLKNDPKELHNLSDGPEYQSVILNMKERMLQWYQETCDIVPKQPDLRFNEEMLLSKLSTKLSKGQMESVRKRISKGESLNNILKNG